jgi:predicted LPLAT superfamily acyltransferase
MRFVLASRRLLGRQGCQVVLLPVVTWFWITERVRRRASMDYLQRVSRQAGLPPPRWWHGVAHYLDFALKALDSVVAAQSPAMVGPLRVQDPDGLARLAASGCGGMVVVSHLGNADISRAALGGRLPRGMTVLMHTRHAAHYNQMLDRLHGDPLSRTLQVTEMGPETAIDLQQRIERGEWLAMAADRTPVGGGGRVARASFLGAPAAFPLGPWVLAGLLGCPVFLLFCLRDPDGGHTVHLELFTDQVALPRGGRDAALAKLVERFAQRLEHHTLLAPRQWYNFYDFWAS